MSRTVLDDWEEMRKIDKSNTLAFYVNSQSHYRQSLENAQNIKFDYIKPENIVLAGMGGSAIGGELLKDYTRSVIRVPVEVSRDYRLPAYASNKSLVILASYSGDTEETLSSFLDALNRDCMVFCISSGGTLIKYAQRLNVPYLQVQGGMPPRAALPHMLIPLLKCLEKLELIPSFLEEFSEAEDLLMKVSRENAPSEPTTSNVAKTLASNINGAVPAVYGFGVYRGTGLRFKQQFNENAKVPSKWDTFSELNHNETMGWEGAKKLARCYAMVFLRDQAEPVEIRSRIETTKSLMQPIVPKIFEVWARGRGHLAKMLSTILVGDFTSVYLAMLREVDPTPVETVKVMKERIEQNGVKKKIIKELDKLAPK